VKESSPDIRPWLFVPVLYVMQAIPATLVREVSTLVYKDFGIPNARIALWVSLLGLPWMLKMFWSPVVDLNFTRRRWVLAAQTLIVAALAGLAAAWRLPAFFPVTLAILFVMGLASATHDVALDGLYLLSLSKQQQAYFVGVQSACFRAGRLLCTGVLVFLAGILQQRGQSIVASWTVVFALIAVLYGAGAVYARIFVPRPAHDVPVRCAGESVPALAAFTTFLRQRGIVAVLAFILFYRFGEAMVTMIAPLFMRDAAAVGGMGLSVAEVGVINGVAGIVGIILGGIAGGAVIGRYGLRRSLWPLAIAMHAPNLFYVWAAAAHPPAWTMYGVAFVDQFGYGFGFAGYSVYLMYVAQRGNFRTSHYAIATGLGMLTIMLAGIFAGWLQSTVGYVGFFIGVCVCTIPGMVTLFFIPLDEPQATRL
jgi:PAT family beta-lactamase induction signal transducer AmpG